MTKRKIFFRADADAQIGYGHFTRTLALADMLREYFDCTFFTQSPSEYQQREAEKICTLVALPSDNSRFEKFLDYLTGEEIVVLDNYFYTTEYQKRIKGKGCKLVCIDDMHDKHYYADIVINHAVGLDRNLYELEPYTELCTGLNWSLLRKEFLKSFTRNQKELRDVFVCLGGSDALNITHKAISGALQINDTLKVQVVLGDAYPFGTEINSAFGNNHRVCLYKSLSAQGMVELMSACRIGFVSASSLLWETQQVGLPVVYGYYAENQKDICRNNPTIGHSVCAYDYITISVDKIVSLMHQLYDKDVDIIHTNAENVITNYINLFKSRVTYRRAKTSDCDLYYKWANDPSVRQMAYNKAPIPYNNHVTWFYNKIKSNNSCLYLYYYKRNPIGQVRYDIEDGKAEIDISLDKEFRGMNLGFEILKKSIQTFSLEYPNILITSEVFAENTASQNTFSKCGFTLVKKSETVFFYELHHTI